LFGDQQTRFTANASQLNESDTCAREAGTEVCGCDVGRKLIFTTEEIDFYHHAISFLPAENLIFLSL